MPTFEIFNMPDAGEGLTEADVVTWRVAVGDTVEVNQPLVEIETAKSLVELPSPVDGLVTRLIAAEGMTVEVGEPIAEFDIDPGGEPAPEGAAPAAAEPAAAPAEQAAPAADSAASSGGTYAPAAASSSSEEKSDAVLVGYGVKAGSAHRRP
ncbi:biotin/lipoyl-containing protein, partial [Demequina sp.]|uniref:biotin/lipoyl-containing protein n=1 Tax=Demequina sp. TaxID=2050685 RepID=UPI0025E28B55